MRFPKITVITPSFNQGNYIEDTIVSVINQHYPNLEYIIIDGGSTDKSVKTIESYANKLKFWVSEKDEGQSHAINKGFAQTTGEIVTWINSDDQLAAGALYNVAEYFQRHSNCYVVHGKSLLFGDNMNDTIKGANSKDLDIQYSAGLPFPQPSSFFRRQALEKYGLLDTSLHYGMDYDFFLRIFLHQNFLSVDDLLSKYLIHETSKSNTQHIGFAQDYAKIFSKLLRSFDHTNHLIEKMKILGIYHDGQDSYTVSKALSPDYIERAFFYNLKFQLAFYYEALDLKKSYQITAFLLEYAPEFFNEYTELSSIYTRSKYLNKTVMKIMRKFTR